MRVVTTLSGISAVQSTASSFLYDETDTFFGDTPAPPPQRASTFFYLNSLCHFFFARDFVFNMAVVGFQFYDFTFYDFVSYR